METPPELEAAASEREEITITKREYDDEQIIAVDFGPVVGEVELDVVDDTAIVVAGDRQLEFDVPPDADDVTVNDGILTIKN
ncbi:DUF7127 family protein [Natrarchaeobaculum aegyptiacum]|uniref:Hsp20/alpha crystallin family protein n=1 Tax=Natrarchaeobaculum aegyptiacum TaxID=745377 RepID=A0A2Z2HRI7_9EURY|nr:hypothetical protein [Natrarchaeobaculum aegyptiacum]ARS89672.1 hypothetical protein B1756_07910 [Natrarchaeobaculum aegyptiacum]